ncbi:MAG: hypothetical protein WAT39_08990 [Planctomycetota bacterium]
MAGFKETLKDAVRQLAFRTSLASLKKKGVSQVNVLGLDRITGLIEAAVHKSLSSRLVGADREAVADATKAEFLRLLRSNEDLQRQKTEIEAQRERAEDEVDQLRRELQQQHQALQKKLEQQSDALVARYHGEDAEIARKVSEVVRSLAQDPQTGLADLEQRLMALLMDVVGHERKAAESARRALQDRDVDNLQRRIKKLTDNLALTEQRLQQVAAMKDVEAGISSIYREVQGLSANAQGATKKKELMAEIFKANVKLQKKDTGSG